jgi:hypothetical protein
MKVRKLSFFLAASVVVSLIICQSWKPASYAEQLIRIQAEQELGPIDRAILNEPIEAQAMLLDYSGNKELVFKAWITLLKYQERGRDILLLYGSESQFKEILLRYGESVIPVIQYFREHDIWSIKARVTTENVVQSVSESAKRIRNRVTENEHKNSNSIVQTQPGELGPKERGWYAVNYIKEEGHDFLGQFVVDKDNRVKWNQTNRTVKAVISFFTSGVRTLETKYDLGEDITASDAFWAALDVAVVVAPLKMLVAGKVVAPSGKELSLVTRTKLFAPRLVAKEQIFRKIGKYGPAVAIAFIAIRNPSLINSVFAEIAKLLGVNPWLVQFVGWVLIVTVILYPFSWLLKPLTRFMFWGLSWLEQSRKKAIPKIATAASDSIAAVKLFFCQFETCCRYCRANRLVQNPLADGNATN